MPRTISSSEAKSRFDELVKWTSENQEQVIVKVYGEPAAVIMSYKEYEEVEKLRKREQKRKALEVLDALREEARRQNPNLRAEEAYRLAGFAEAVVQETLHADKKRPMMSIATMSGLEIMQAMIEGKIPHPSIATTIPMKGISAEYGKIVFEATADDRHLNPLGGVHGGFTATVLDSVTGCAVHTVLGPGTGYGTVDLNIKMLKAIPPNVSLIAEGKVIHISKLLGVAEGTLKDKDGTLYAHATATCIISRTIDKM